MKNKSIRLFILIVLVVPIALTGMVSFFERNVRKLPVLKKAQPFEDFHLYNQEGIEKSTFNWKGKIVVANFFFTHCPVVCPKMMHNLKVVSDQFSTDSNILFNSFSVDPDRDSMAQLKAYVRMLKINSAYWDLLTGNKKTIYRLARNGFDLVATDGDGGPDDFIHSDQIVLMDEKRNIRGYYNGSSKSETDQLINDIKKLKNEN